MEKNIRNNNLDLLKVIAVIFVLICHYLNKNMGGAFGKVELNSLNYYLSYFLESIAIISVNLFVLISGYFFIDKNEIKISKICSLLITTIFYCTVIYLIFLILGYCTFTLDSIIDYVKSILSFWFVYIYIIMYLLSPFLNKLLNNLNKKQYMNLILIFFIFFSLWPSFINDLTVKDSGYGIINFILLYMLAGYQKRYKQESKKIYYVYYILCVMMTFLFSLITSRAFHYNFVFNILSSLFLFKIFLKFNFKNKFIYKLSKHSFSIYIIHLQPLLVPVFFNKIFRCQDYYNSNFFILHLIITVIGIYFICLIIDLLKEKLLDNIINKILKKIKILNFTIKI